eukprot:scaffold21493_cov107-Isochrysis_galbana.AAC.3
MCSACARASGVRPPAVAMRYGAPRSAASGDENCAGPLSPTEAREVAQAGVEVRAQAHRACGQSAAIRGAALTVAG